MREISERLLAQAIQCNSDSFIIWQNDCIVVEHYSELQPKPIQLRSITKSIAGLAIVLLIDAGKIISVDEPAHHFLPEWNTHPYCQITIRHLMTHTSGLADADSPRLLETSISNIVDAAMKAPIVDNPGSSFVYNNLAVNALAGIVRSITGETLLDFLSRQLFLPLDIHDLSWISDHAGNNYVHAGLEMRADDLCKIGQLILNNGIWKGRHILSAEGIMQATRIRQARQINSGLLWWLFPNDEDKLARYVNSNGDFGQWLIVDFLSRSVIVRQIHLQNFLSDEHGYWNLFRLIMESQ